MLPLRTLLVLTVLSLAPGALAPAQEKEAGMPRSQATQENPPTGMTTRIFRIPRTFGGPPVPVGAPLKDSRKILENAGVTFPPGASASFDSVADLLVVTNTAANLKVTEEFVTDISMMRPRLITCLVTIVEGPGGLIREASAAAAAGSGDAAPQLTRLLDLAKQAGPAVRVVGDCFVEVKSGTRATSEAVQEHSAPSPLELDAHGRAAAVEYEQTPSGLHLELEPTVSSNDIIDCSLALTLDAAPPLVRQMRTTDPATGNAAEFPTSAQRGMRFITQLRMTSGQTRLIGVARPGNPMDGKSADAEQDTADVLRAAFITTTLRPVEVPAENLMIPQMLAGLPQNGAALQTAEFEVPAGVLEAVAEPPFELRPWLASQGVVFGPGAEVSHQGGILRITGTPLDVARVAVIVQGSLDKMGQTAALTLQTFQAPAALLRDLARQTPSAVDDTAMLAAVQAAAARGDATCVDFISFNGEMNQSSTWSSGPERRFLTRFSTDAQGRPSFEFDTRHAGTRVEVTPSLWSHDGTLDMTLRHEVQPAAPMTRRDRFVDPASKQPFDLPATDFHIQRTSTALTLRPDGCKLLSLHQPMGRDAPDLLWATFVSCAAVMHVPPPAPPSPPKRDATPAGDGQAWDTRRFRVPPDFLGEKSSDTGSRRTAREILEDQRIPFPEGAMASFNPALSKLVVRNTRENLARVAAYVETLQLAAGPNIVLSAQVFQGPGPMLRRLAATAATQPDHRAALDEMLAAAKAGSVRHVDIARLEMLPSAQAASEQITEHPGFLSLSIDQAGKTVFHLDKRPVGFLLKGSPLLSADGRSVDLTLDVEFHTAPLQERLEHLILPGGRRLEFPLSAPHFLKITTLLALPAGHTRLLSVWKPTGRPEFDREDLLQAMFVTCYVQGGGK